MTRLCETIRGRGTPLSKLLGRKPLYGIKTGFNAAFLIDTAARNKLVWLIHGAKKSFART